jgi:hypothetical protein
LQLVPFDRHQPLSDADVGWIGGIGAGSDDPDDSATIIGVA